ncbi:hypothetical protein [Bradyrhizobium japonicum]|uniref:hypothetical protein n=1 Tax=Bradyrhizobium japonicum TaxID=375 RepID=UPI0004074632|nr:hypothetical protein [Bradyrhizobium japonicum]
MAVRIMSLRIVKTFDQADWELLSLANEKGKFGIGLATKLEEDQQLAFERGIDAQWFTFVDLSTVASMPGAGLIQLYRLTEAGAARRAELAANHGVVR